VFDLNSMTRLFHVGLRDNRRRRAAMQHVYNRQPSARSSQTVLAPDAIFKLICCSFAPWDHYLVLAEVTRGQIVNTFCVENSTNN
jgi:hypothetical protein